MHYYSFTPLNEKEFGECRSNEQHPLPLRLVRALETIGTLFGTIVHHRHYGEKTLHCDYPLASTSVVSTVGGGAKRGDPRRNVLQALCPPRDMATLKDNGSQHHRRLHQPRIQTVNREKLYEQPSRVAALCEHPLSWPHSRV